jgi:predicted GNAT family N-acyltransferase
MLIELYPWKIAKSISLPIRIEVFVHEQGVPLEIEQDIDDSSALHAILFNDGIAIGTGRLFQEDSESTTYMIGRVCVLKRHRQQGGGLLIMRSLIKEAQHLGATQCQIHAQVSSQSFYERLGFISTSEIFMEAGIEHVMMHLTMPQ